MVNYLSWRQFFFEAKQISFMQCDFVTSSIHLRMQVQKLLILQNKGNYCCCYSNTKHFSRQRLRLCFIAYATFAGAKSASERILFIFAAAAGCCGETFCRQQKKKWPFSATITSVLLEKLLFVKHFWYVKRTLSMCWKKSLNWATSSLNFNEHVIAHWYWFDVANMY